jgi:choline kinase
MPPGNPQSVAAARELIDAGFLLLMSDHLIDEPTISANDRPKSGVLLAIDRRDRGPRATRVLEEHRRIVDTGKALPSGMPPIPESSAPR